MFSQLMADIGFSGTLTADIVHVGGRGMALLTADIGPINKDVWPVNIRH
jgi:hypothetical protein